MIVVFGITGDLARRKILPGLYHLAVAGLLPEKYRIVGCGRPTSHMTHDEFRSYAYDAVSQFAKETPTYKEWAEFSSNLTYAIDPDDGPDGLPAVVAEAEAAIGGVVRRLFHLAIPPDAMHDVITMLGTQGLQQERAHRL